MRRIGRARSTPSAQDTPVLRRKSYRAMLSVLPFVVLVAAVAAPAPAPSPSPPPTKLQEIGRVRSAPICTTIVVHANGAITQALDNDRSLAVLTTNLRAIDFDRENELQRRNSIDALMRSTQAVRMNFRAADGEIKTLRAIAEASKDPQRKAELKAFADALGGALQRQKRAAEEFDRDVVIMRGRQEAAEMRAVEQRDARLVTAGAIAPHVLDRMDQQRASVEPQPVQDGQWNKTMRDIAESLDERVAPIASDEGIAADHSIAATTGC